MYPLKGGPCATRSRVAWLRPTFVTMREEAAGAARLKESSRIRASSIAAADKGASSPRLPGTIQSIVIVRGPGLVVGGALQQVSQSALMKCSARATGVL